MRETVELQADYKYYDMHQVVGSALVRSEKEE